MALHIMPDAVQRAVAQVRSDAADFMQHSTTADIKARRMCRVGFTDAALLLAWLEQHFPAESGAGVAAAERSGEACAGKETPDEPHPPAALTKEADRG